MTAPDLTPAEARAEIEAFMGPGWFADATSGSFAIVRASCLGVTVQGVGPTYRAAVSALKAVWRDAVAAYTDHVVLNSGGF